MEGNEADARTWFSNVLESTAQVLLENKYHAEIEVDPNRIASSYPPLPKRVVEIDNIRKQAYRDLSSSNGDPALKWARYKRLRAAATRMRAESTSASFTHCMASNALKLAGARSGSSFHFFKRLMSRGSRRSMAALKDPITGLMVSSEAAKTELLSNHFELLGTATKTLDDELEHWSEHLDYSLSTLEGIDAPITWREICVSISGARNSCPGASGMSNEVLKMALTAPPPPSARGRTATKP